ncbi:MAG TPA: transglutaminase-like domain-containing protein, partial [Spirochaetia bacterium]|nr:transglutaminase-like domain-containing protein [Spirochaetia bacterium]
GIPSDQWNNGQTGSQGKNRQYAVMVVKSPVDPTYAAEGYFGKLDPVAGFVKTPDQSLNALTNRHLLETWTNTSPTADLGRQSVSISFMSTLPERVLAYEPQSVEPTVLNNQYYPFSYSYDSVSLMDTVSPTAWQGLPGLTPEQKQEFAPYLSVPLAPADKKIFEGYLAKHVGDTSGYFDKLIAILKGFSTYQYQVGFSDSVTVHHLENFLANTKEGDCTEFSNTTALLARMEGIPSRVVTGYLAAKELQTPAHLRGLAVLREKIKPLQKYPMSELYLVTTADHHSWVQVWLPTYGWVDIETTSFAIPPAAGGDPNNWNVVIPLISSRENPAPAFQIPWGLVLRTLIVLIAFTLIVVYFYRWGREVYLLYLSRGRGRHALESLYKLLLLRLVENNLELKTPATTPSEYARHYPALAKFAELYTQLRFKERIGPDEHERLWRELKAEYRAVLRTYRSPGVAGSLRRAFSLKGLYYRW